jgi:hypothetical protein
MKEDRGALFLPILQRDSARYNNSIFVLAVNWLDVRFNKRRFFLL